MYHKTSPSLYRTKQALCSTLLFEQVISIKVVGVGEAGAV